VPTIDWTEGDDPIDETDLDNKAYFDELVKAYDWWEDYGKSELNGITGQTYTITWTTVIANATIRAEATGADQDADNIDWTQALIDASRTAFNLAVQAIDAQFVQAAADLNLPAAGSGYDDPEDDDADAAYLADLTQAQRDNISDMEDLYDEFSDYVLGEDTDDSWAASSPITNAYLRLNQIAGVLDLSFELNGKAVAVGSMVTTHKTTGDADLGVSAALSSGVVPGLSASVLFTSDGGEFEDDDDTTYDYEKEEDDPIQGLQINAGYSSAFGPLTAGVDLSYGFEDIAETSEFGFSLRPSVSAAELYGLSVSGEFQYVGADDPGMGAAAKIGATVMGITPSVAFYWKDEYFGGDDSRDYADKDDVNTDTSAMATFNSVDDETETMIGIAVKADLAELMGMKLLTVSGGYDMVTEQDLNGWNVGVGVDLNEVAGQPVTASFNTSKYADEDTVWTAKVNYLFAQNFNASFTLSQPEEEVISWGIAGKVSF
jgi:hypothetical protein